MALTDPSSWGLDDVEQLMQVRQQRLDGAPDDGRPADDVHFSSERVRQREQKELREETAVHLAVTLWALHQQSVRDVPMHLPGWPLGRAVRRLAHGRTGASETPDNSRNAGGRTADPTETRKTTETAVEEASETIRKRFVRIGTSSEIDVLARRLREMVQLLRGARIPLDYGLLADQLYFWQDDARRAETCRMWGREFHTLYRSSKPGQDNTESGESTPAPALAQDTDPDAGAGVE